jgi:hypothetical protein
MLLRSFKLTDKIRRPEIHLSSEIDTGHMTKYQGGTIENSRNPISLPKRWITITYSNVYQTKQPNKS